VPKKRRAYALPLILTRVVYLRTFPNWSFFKEVRKMSKTTSRARSARLATDEDNPARRTKRKSSRSKRPKGIQGYWVEIGMVVLIAAFLCPTILYKLVNRIPASGNGDQKNAVLTPKEFFFSKDAVAPRNAQRPESSSSSSLFKIPEFLTPAPTIQFR